MYLKNRNYDSKRFCLTAASVGQDEKLGDYLMYQFPGFKGVYRIIDAEIGETKDYKFAVLSRLCPLTQPGYKIWIVEKQEILGTIPGIGQTYEVMDRNEEKRGYCREAKISKVEIVLLPKVGINERYVRSFDKDLPSFIFCADGPIKKPYSNGYQYIALLDSNITMPDKVSVLIHPSSNSLDISYAGITQCVDLEVVYKATDLKRITEVGEKIKDEGERVYSKVEQGLKTGTMIGLESYLNHLLFEEKDPLELHLVKRALRAIE